MQIQFIHYLQIFISIFLLTACAGTLNVQLEPPEDTLPVQTTAVVSRIEVETAPVSTIVPSRPALVGTLDGGISSQPPAPKSTDQSATAGLSGYKNPIFNYDPSLVTSTVVESRPAVPQTSDSPYWHALPDEWQNMEYQDFLVARRERIAKIIRDVNSHIPLASLIIILL